MELSRLSYDPAQLLDFYEDILELSGCLCERTWYDQLFVIPGVASKTFWPAELSEINLRFRAASDSAAVDPTQEVFPGSPLTFSICETFLNDSVIHRAALQPLEQKLPASEVIERRWSHQYPAKERLQITTPFVAAVHFSVIAVLRCEIQAVDQHWTQYRLAINLQNGDPDPQLAEQLAVLEPWSDPTPIDWPEFSPEPCRKVLLTALEREAWPAVKAIKVRQSKYLQRELDTVDRYYSDYEANLTDRMNRTRSDDGRAKMQARLEAARQEHQIRRIDQIKRHEIHVFAHVDALLMVAEPAHRTQVRYISQRQVQQQDALWIPRTRSWVVAEKPDCGS